MAPTTVNLNENDWSNLLIVDYPGGAGGEMLSAKIAADVNALHYFDKNQNHSGSVVDSCGNEFSCARFCDMILERYNVSTPEDLHNNPLLLQQVMKFSIVMWGHNQSMRSLEVNGLFDPKHPIGHYPWGNVFNHFMKYFNVDIDTDSKVIADNVVVRLHNRTLPTEQLGGSKRVRLYPKTEQEAYNNAVRMCTVKWLEVRDPSNLAQIYDKCHITSWPAWLQKVYKEQWGNLFEWQVDCFLKNIDHLRTFEDFYDDYLQRNLSIDTRMISKYNDSIISSYSWTDRGLNTLEKEQYQDIVGVKYRDTTELANWRDKNKSVFTDRLGVDIDNTERNLIKRKVLKLARKTCIQLR